MLTIPLTDSARAADIAALERKCETVEASLFRRLAPVLPSLLLRRAAPQSVDLAAGNAPVPLAAHGRPQAQDLSRRLAKLRMRSRY